MRMSPQMKKAVEQHIKRMEKRTPGVQYTQTQAVHSLVESGSMAWRLSEQAGVLNPTGLLMWAADNFGKRKK